MTWLRLAVSAALIAWILSRAPLAEIVAAFRSADLRFVLLAMAVNPVAYLASLRRWRLLIRAQGGDADLSYLLRSFLTGVFFNNLLPSTVGGDAVRALDTARLGVGKVKGAAVVFVDRFVGLLALTLFATAGLLASGRLTARIPELSAWVLGGAAALGVLAALLFLPFAKSRLGALAAFQGKGSVLARAFAWSLLLQTQVVLNGYLLARALHVAVPLPYFFLIVPLALFAMMLPVSINGIGVRESAWAFFLAPFGVPAATAVAVAWLDYGLLLGQAAVGGAVYARRGRLRAEASPPGPLSLTGEGERFIEDRARRVRSAHQDSFGGAHSAPYNDDLSSQVPPLPSGRGGQGVRIRSAERRDAQGALEAAP